MLILFRRRTPITRLSEGQVVVVEGKVEATTELSLPGSGARCVYYDIMIESFGQGARGAGRPMWLPMRTETKLAAFVLDDGGGKVMVSAKPENLRISGCRKQRGPYDKTGRQRYVASLLGAGETVRVRGLARAARKKGEHKGMLVIGPDLKGVIEIRVR